MRLFIPSVGMKFKVISPWTFVLQEEDRNFGLLEKLNNIIPSKILKKKSFDWSYPSTSTITFSEKTLLKIDRIYIRKGYSSEYNSVSFRVKTTFTNERTNKLIDVKGRFWASLDDVNRLEVEEYTGDEI